MDEEEKRWLDVEILRRREHLKTIIRFEQDKLTAAEDESKSKDEDEDEDEGESATADVDIDVDSVISAVEEVARCSRLDKLVVDGYLLACKGISLKINSVLSCPTRVKDESKEQTSSHAETDGQISSEVAAKLVELRYAVRRVYDDCDTFLLSKRPFRKVLDPSVERMNRVLSVRRTSQLYKAIQLIRVSFKNLPLIGVASLLSLVYGNLEAVRVEIMSRIVNLATTALTNTSKSPLQSVSSSKEASSGLKSIRKVIQRLFLVEMSLILLNFIREKLNEKGLSQFTRQLKARVFKAIMDQDLEYMEKNDMEEVSSLVLRVDHVASSLYSLPVTTVDLLSRISASVIFLSRKSRRFAVFMAVLLPLQLAVTYTLSSVRDYLESLTMKVDVRGSFGRIMGALNKKEAFVDLKTMTRETIEGSLFEQRLKAHERYVSQGKFFYSVFSPITDLVEKVVHIASLYYGSVLLNTNNSTCETSPEQELRANASVNLTEYISLCYTTFERCRYLYVLLQSFNEDILNPAERMYDLIELKPRIRASELTFEACMKLDISAWDLTFDHVSFAYPTRKKALALKDVSFRITQGERIGIMGESGCGKSTLFALMLKLYAPDAGEILIDGVELRKLSSRFLRQNVAVVSQAVYFPYRTVRQNLLYAIEGRSGSLQNDGPQLEERMRDVLRAAQCHDLFLDKKRFPQEWHTDLGRNCDKLSGGEKQRLNLARVLLRKPRILLLDEYTSALDEDLQYKVQESLNKIYLETGKTMTIINIAHRLSNFRNCDRILVMDKGSVAEIGTVDELLASSASDSIFKTFVQRHNEAFPTQSQ